MIYPLRKKCIITISILILIPILGCSRSKNENNDKKNKIIIKADPNNIDLNKPIPVGDLKKAYFAWNGRKITIKGYCDFFFDEGSIKKDVELTASPDSKEKLIKCEMTKNYDEKFSKKIPVIITGTVKDGYYGKIRLTNCMLVSKGDKKINTIKASLMNIDSNKPMEILDFHNTFFAWKDKEVTVTGYYFGTTTSTTKYGKTIRIDLKDPATGEIAVGCEMKKEHKRIDKRDGVIIKGIITRDVFGRVRMKDCELMNR